MRTTTKTYIRVSQGEGDAQKFFAWPDSRIKRAEEEHEDFTRYATLTSGETEWDNAQEFMAASIPDDVRADIINRGWTLAQQQAARALVLEENADYINSSSPVDLFEAAIAPKERRKASNETKARRSLSSLAEEDPEKLLALIAEFQAQLASSK